MKLDQEFYRLVSQEFGNITSNLIWQNESGEYEAFGRYRIVANRPGYRVFCSATDVGIFSSTRTALSWCIADKNQAYNLARDLKETDVKLSSLTVDINSRATIGDRSSNLELREIIATKLESKIIQKKQLENRLSKCVNWAKYIQQRGFNNETARTSRNQPNKAGR
jgi:hypothetical protein